MKTTFLSLDGEPAVLQRYEDGRILAFDHVGGAWTPTNAADAATEGRVISEADFKKRWPDVSLDGLPK